MGLPSRSASRSRSIAAASGNRSSGLLAKARSTARASAFAHGGVEQRKRRRMIVAVLLTKQFARLASERGLAGQKLIERCTHRIDVGPRVDSPARPLLGCHVVRRSQKRSGVGHRQRLAIDDVAGEPEVGDLDSRPRRVTVFAIHERRRECIGLRPEPRFPAAARCVCLNRFLRRCARLNRFGERKPRFRQHGREAGCCSA